MSQPSSSQPILIGVLSGALVVAVSAAIFFYFKLNQTVKTENPPKEPILVTPVNTQASVSQVAIDVPTPNKVDAFNTLFGVNTKHGKIKTAKYKISSIWFDKKLTYGTDTIYVVFTLTYNLNEATGDIDSCHACAPEIGAITYKKQANEWAVISKQPSFTSFGSWGEAGDVKPEPLLLSKLTTSFLLDTSYGNTGMFTSGKTIFSFADDTWRDLGNITTEENNAGACDETVPPTDEFYRKCWAYEGKISIVPKQNTQYPDLLVTRTGTFSEGDTVKNQLYKFDGKSYVDSTIYK